MPTKEWKVDFTCPHCGEEADIYIFEWCRVYNTLSNFQVAEDGEVNVEWGDSDIQEGDGEVSYCCDSCREEIDPTIRNETDLFNWLKERDMVSQ